MDAPRLPAVSPLTHAGPSTLEETTARALEVALAEAELEVRTTTALPGAGFAHAVAVRIPRVARHRHLDRGLHTTPFDPSVPHFLDEKGPDHWLTGRRPESCSKPATPLRPGTVAALARWWRRTDSPPE